MKSKNTEKENAVKGLERIVIKVGSRLLVDEKGFPCELRIKSLIDQIALLRAQNIEVILVSSGAIGAGLSLMKMSKRPENLPQLQAAAAIGQNKLMSMYEQAARKYDFHCAQILLTSEDVSSRARHLNIVNCLNAILKNGNLPIINENDSVSLEEIQFGENDCLAALTGIMCKAELTILLTTVDGLCKKTTDGLFTDTIPIIKELSSEILALAGDSADPLFSTGGMASKLKAAELIMNAGENLWIANGTNFAILEDIFKGVDIGSLFIGKKEKLKAHKRWLAFFTDISGKITLDDGAVEAISKKGKSLLPGGIITVSNHFQKGAALELCDKKNNIFARGITNYSSEDINRIKGQKSQKITTILGYHIVDEVIHRDNMVII